MIITGVSHKAAGRSLVLLLLIAPFHLPLNAQHNAKIDPLEMAVKQAIDDAVRAEQEKKDALAREELERQKVVRNSLVGGFGLMAALGGLMFRGYRQKKRSNKLLEMKNALIEEQHRMVESRNKDIADSINYARRIQDAILPTKEKMQALFPQSFILYKPRDIVSGDFFWVAEHKGRKYVATVDCTCHGIPGAFMSMVGSALLNSTVLEKHIHDPTAILAELREGMIQLLRLTEENGNRDRMDISLCVFESSRLKFSTADNSLWLIRNHELTEYKADKQPIGIYSDVSKTFTTHDIELITGDSVYIFTDGYTDQFGGPEGKKFGCKNLQKLLLEVNGKPMAEQELLLSEAIESWCGHLDQVDDILVAGIRI